MARWNLLTAWLCLFLCLQLAVGRHTLPPMKRQDGEASATAAITSSVQPETTQDGGAATSSTPSPVPTSTTAANSASSSATVPSSSALPTISGGDSPLDNSTLFNTTIPEGQLPLEPKITPGWGVAGVILLCAGVVYTMIGIKNSILHNTFSVAYIVGLGITVLIVYLMTIPVTNGNQGGYVAAAVLPAILVGLAASWFFREITECFACALGGFCFGMWLLCLQEGGLLSGTGKTILIIIVSLAGFAAYFTRWTRDWALIIGISFAGATSTVLGIDCFSKAGLKEFWAYIWQLNENLFPLGADTYPLTKGIRVELAAIIVIFCIGIISQKRLWNVIKDHRAKKQEELAEIQRARDMEEANIGKQVEAAAARERRAWERVHGDHDSGFAPDNESEKGLRESQSNSNPGPQLLSVAEMPGSEVSPAVPPKKAHQGLVISGKEDGTVTVRVAPDEVPTELKVAHEAVDEKKEAQQTIENNNASTHEAVTSPVPEVVPLPFRFPDPQENTLRAREDRSSIATFAGEDEETGIVSNRGSFAKRLSQSSTTLMRRISQRTAKSRQENGPSSDELAVLRQRGDDNDDGSIAATIDTESDSGSDITPETRPQSIEVDAQLAEKVDANDEHSTTESVQKVSLPQPGAVDNDNSKRISVAETLANDAPTQPLTEEEPAPCTPAANRQAEQDGKDAADDAVAEKDVAKDSDQADAQVSQQPVALSQKTKSVVSVDSKPMSLTTERLPPGFSHVALHYRTNEWAKHLSLADTPAPETFQVIDYPEAGSQQEETPAPVNVEELKQTALTATPAPVPIPSPARPVSIRGHSRASSSLSGAGLEKSTSPTAMNRQSQIVSHRRVPSKTQVPTVQTIAEEKRQMPSRAPSTRSGSSGRMSVGFERPPPPPGVTSYDSPQSLLAQRSVALRNKTYGILTGANSMPDIPISTQRTPSESGSLHSYALYPVQVTPASYDDLPLSQRKELIRRQSLVGTIQPPSFEPRSSSGAYIATTSADNHSFDSHQPVRHSNLPSQEARDARLASFRNSVRADLRASIAVAPAGANGRDSAMMFRSASSSNLAAQTTARDADLQRNIDLQRSFMMSQKETEARRREKERLEKERADKAFTRSMQSGEMFDLHRDMMRRMQSGVKDA